MPADGLKGPAPPDSGSTPAGGDDGMLGRNVVTLGWVAFFGGLAQDMIQPILPVFYTRVLGLSTEFVGFIEGTLTTVVSVMKVGAGYASDRLRARKPVVFVGYALSAAGRFALGFAATGAGTFACRLTDGLGKGIKDAPRDALVAGSARRGRLGRAFGLQRALDTLGSVAGPLITWILLSAWVGQPSAYRRVFWIAGLIATVPLGLIALRVRERPAAGPARPPARFRLTAPFGWFLALSALFALGNSSDAFLVLRATNLGLPVALVPVVVALMNLTSAAAATPFGALADRIGRRRMLAAGWVVYALVYLGFGFAGTAVAVWWLYGLYGLFYALTEGSAKALVAELVPEEARGRAYGAYNASLGVLALPASLLAGILWNRVSPAAPFYFGGAVALVAVLGLSIAPAPEDSGHGR